MANKITQTTVLEMYQALAQEIKKGNGGKYLLCGDDNEGNGYHGCFFTVAPVSDVLMDIVSDSQIMDPNKLMIIG